MFISYLHDAFYVAICAILSNLKIFEHTEARPWSNQGRVGSVGFFIASPASVIIIVPFALRACRGHSCVGCVQLEPLPHEDVRGTLHLKVLPILLYCGLTREYHVEVAATAEFFAQLNDDELLFKIEVTGRLKVLHASYLALHVV